jgi:hypothetical protein
MWQSHSRKGKMMIRKFVVGVLPILTSAVFAAAADNPLPHVSVSGTATTEVVPDQMVWHLTIKNTGSKLPSVAEQQTRSKLVPAILSLDHPATVEDVNQGLAVFQLNGKGKNAEMKLPAVATLMQEGQDKNRVLVVQAEVNADGKTICGIITEHEIKTVDAEELKDVKEIPKVK